LALPFDFGTVTFRADIPMTTPQPERQLEERLKDIEVRETQGNPFLPPEDSEAGFSWVSLLVPFWAVYRFFEFLWEERERRKREALDTAARLRESSNWRRTAATAGKRDMHEPKGSAPGKTEALSDNDKPPKAPEA
jgi:hypothetical protein